MMLRIPRTVRASGTIFATFLTTFFLTNSDLILLLSLKRVTPPGASPGSYLDHAVSARSHQEPVNIGMSGTYVNRAS